MDFDSPQSARLLSLHTHRLRRRLRVGGLGQYRALLAHGLHRMCTTDVARRLWRCFASGGSAVTSNLLSGCALATLALLVGAGCRNEESPASSDAAQPLDLERLRDAASPPDLSSLPDLGPPPPTLTLSLDPTLDGDGDIPKAMTIAYAELLDGAGARVAAGALAGDSAVIVLLGLVPGDYFIKVNGDADDLVPTRIDDPGADLVQRVGTALRTTMIGPLDAPVYCVKSYSAGQGQSPVVRFGDGTPVPGRYPYVLATLALAEPVIELRVLGTAEPITSVGTPNTHQTHDLTVAFDDWLVNTIGKTHHGDAYQEPGAPAMCASCHLDMDEKAPWYDATLTNVGWCYRCHYGTGGSDSGFIDPTQ